MTLAANADGTQKLPLLLLRKAATPDWLCINRDAVDYVGSARGWMTVSVFQMWLRKIDAGMARAGRRVLLLLDNAPFHIKPREELSSVFVLKLPPNVMSLLQPRDQGLISYVKQGVLR